MALVAPDSTGRLWIAFADGRLGVRERDGTVHVLSGDLPSKQIEHLCDCGRSPRAHLARHGSRHCAGRSAGRWPAPNPESGLPTGRISTVVEDGDGYLWADTSAGLLRIRADEFDKAASTPGYHAQFEFFDASDGAAGAPTITSRRDARGTARSGSCRSGALTIADPQVLRQRARPTPGAGHHRQHQSE